MTPSAPVGRVPVLDCAPLVAGGRWPAKAFAGEVLPLSATVFVEGHERAGATAVLTDPDGRETAVRMSPGDSGTDRWHVLVCPDRPGDWTFRVEGWRDDWTTWLHDARIRLGVPDRSDHDVELALEAGALLLDRAAGELRVPRPASRAARSRRRVRRPAADVATLRAAADGLRDTGRPPEARLAAADSVQVAEVFARDPLRAGVTPGPECPLLVERERAGVGAWYEFFPRSVGAHRDAAGHWVSGTLREAATRLDEIAGLGFDVVYLPPVHPIGTSHRKGRNNALDAAPDDPGSPWAIGSPAGGHDAIEPGLGTFDDFDAFVARARSLGLEVALDLALQCSPDHPWVTEHPEWFVHRADGSIAYAENPPKKYQDIYPLNFDTDPAGILAEVRRIVELWIRHGVSIFRVDNPHTKPVWFWERLLADVRADHPGIVFLAEAFTRPAVLHTLAQVGFQQSYTYFTWRTTAEELRDYATELAHDSAAFLRPNLFVNTPDILTEYLQFGGRGAFEIRAVLAATLAPSWGMYSGFELCEHVARPGAEEYLDNEKYEYRPRDYAGAVERGESIAPFIGRLNAVRRAHPALRQLRNVTFHEADNPAFVVYSKHLPARFSPTGSDDTLLVVVDLDPHWAAETTVHLDLGAPGLGGTGRLSVTDLLSGDAWVWGADAYVRLDPGLDRPAHVLLVSHP